MARRRRKVFLDTNNHDRWIVSYADFITLLFAFFVVMYSISSVNEGKYRSLSSSLGNAFSNDMKLEKTSIPTIQQPSSNIEQPVPLTINFESKILTQPIPNLDDNTEEKLTATTDLGQGTFVESEPDWSLKTGQSSLTKALTVAFEYTKTEAKAEVKTTNTKILNEIPDKPESVLNEPDAQAGNASLLDKLAVSFDSKVFDKQTEPVSDKQRELSDEILKEREQLKHASDQLEQGLGSFIKDDLVAVKRNDFWIELEMNSELLFLSGEAALSKKADPVLKEIAQVMQSTPNAINVEGHTDNIPISNLKFPSNWELSSARATSVVQELVKEGIDPTRLSAVGYGEFHPIGDNLTEEGRFKNRRVTLVLMSQAFSRYGANDAERAKLLNLKPTTPQ